jgi:TetR/AcrR family transcriptional regulator, tetracycline repressor protein
MNVKATASQTEQTTRREPLTKERIVEAALRVMDAEGLEAVTMRRIGRELGVEAMSLYNHVEDKDDILSGVTERVMTGFDYPPFTGDWFEDGRAMAREWRRLLGLHPSVCQLLAERHKPLEGLAAFGAMDAALGLLRSAGLSERDAAQAFNALGSYILGYVTMEQGLMLGNDEEHAKQHDLAMDALRGSGLDNVVACLPHFADCDTDQQFEFGLDLIFRGIRAGVAGTA